MRKTKACKHGTFTYLADDMYVGKSLERYGEFSEDEVSVYRMVLKPDDLAIEVGANIGALTVPLARYCEQVLAFEPFPENYNLLVANLVQNNLMDKVYPYNCAVGEVPGRVSIPEFEQLGHTNYGAVQIGSGDRKVLQCSLDSIVLDELKLERKIKFIKLDCEGSELAVLKGAERLIARDRPILYVENDREEKSAELIGYLLDNGYRCYWHRPPLFNRLNHNGDTKNVFGNTVSISMFCAPEELGVEVDHLDEVADHRVDDQMYARELARTLKILEKNPDDLEARFKAAHYANLDGDVLGARRLIQENLDRDCEHVGSLAIQGLLDLQDGNFAAGWPAYELRYKQKHAKGFGFRDQGVPHWDGQPTDEPVLIWSEQGFGDSIMFVRFMDEVQRRAPRAILEVQPQLFELFETSTIVPTGRLFRLGRALPGYSFHCSLPSLPATMRMYQESDLATHKDHMLGRYLRADRKMIESWRLRDTPRIGVCCRGGAASERAYSRDIPRELVDRLGERFGPFMSLENNGQWESYADTAAAISALDLVITVDTSVAHLSGALGVPTWLMLSSDPDFRWQRNRRDSPWYPSMKIFRQQKFMVWSNVISEIEDHLETQVLQQAAE
jgi:FkbM family methyltransferase